MPAVTIAPRFTPSVSLAAREGQHLTLAVHNRGTLRFTPRSAALADAVARLFDGGLTAHELAAIADGGDARQGPELYYYLDRFTRRQLIGYDWRVDGVLHAYVEPVVSEFSFSGEGVGPGRVVLSRFAYARRVGAHLVLEAPDARARVTLRSEDAVSWFARAAAGTVPDAFAALLHDAGLADSAEGAEPPDRATWEFHDRVFHRRTRRGDEVRAMGGSYRFDGRFPSPPAIKAPMSSERIALAVADETAMRPSSGDSLCAVMERRRTVRDMNEAQPIAVGQVGELLYRVARIVEHTELPRQDLVRRPVPGGGSIHEIEFYLAVRVCAGLPKGLYHYRGVEHALYRLPAGDADVDGLVDEAAASMARVNDPPQVVVVLASRLPRLAWKYEGIAYRVTLLNAGVIMQSLYLVATELNLACSATGTGNSDLFARATGLDSFAETSIGEFALGSRR
jgi:SagB-type dehydrogenase family enzyme